VQAGAGALGAVLLEEEVAEPVVHHRAAEAAAALEPVGVEAIDPLRRGQASLRGGGRAVPDRGRLKGAYACWILISMSTPAGSSMRCSESTVFGVGSRMSMRRLWMRISKCSRLSLSLWGERMTV
jgi:hypothetical protein